MQFLLGHFVLSVLFGLALGFSIQDSLNQELEKDPGFIDWEAPTSVKNKFVYYLSGYDYDNVPIVVMEMGRWDFQGVAEKGGEDLEMANAFIDQLNHRLQVGYFSKNFNGTNSVDDEVVAFLDFDGLKISQARSPPTVKFILERLAKMAKLYKNLSYGFIVNANPVADQIFSIARPFVGNFLEKLEIYGTNARKWIPQVLKKLPRSELHPAYGGFKDFKPVAVYG